VNIVRTVARKSSNRLTYCWLKVNYCICQSNALERKIKRKTEGKAESQPKIWGGHGPPRLPLRTATVHDPLLATPLALHLAHQLPLRKFVLSRITCGLITEAKCWSRMWKRWSPVKLILSFPHVIFTRKQTRIKSFWRKYCLQKSAIGRICKFTNA